MIKRLTARRKAAYIKSNGSACPFCGENVSLEGDSWNCEAGVAWQAISCITCGAVWQDVYHLHTIEVVSGPDPENAAGLTAYGG